MYKNKIILSLLLSTSLLYSSNLQIGSSKNIKSRINTGMVVKYTGTSKGAKVIETSDETKDMASMETKFNCKTGGLSVDAAMLDIPAEFKKTLNDFVENSDDILKELAYQELTEFLLDMLAGIHYNMANETGGTGLEAFKVLSVEKTTECLKATLSKSVEVGVEGGVGWNVYDLFSGKVGINGTTLLSSTECLRQKPFDGTDDEAKKKLAKSKVYVRNLFYKILNESMDFSLKPKISTECKEWDKEKNKKDEIAANLACKGTFIDLSGNETRVDLEAKKVAVGKEDTMFATAPSSDKENDKVKEDSQKEEKAESKPDSEKTEEEKKAEDKKNNKNNLFGGNIKYEATLTKIPSFKVIEGKIDILDLQPFERLVLYKYMYNESSQMLKEKTKHKIQKIREGTLEVVKRILTMSRIDKNKLKEFKCYKSATMCTKENFPEISSIDKIKKEIPKKYLNQLKSEIYNWNLLATGLVSLDQMEGMRLNKKKMVNSDVSFKDMELEILLKQKENKSKWNDLKDFVIGGSRTFANVEGGIILQNKDGSYIKSSLELLKRIVEKDFEPNLNNAVLLLEPVHELEMAKLLYDYSNSTLLIKQLMGRKNDGDMVNFIKDGTDLDKLAYVDYKNTTILGKTNKSFYNFSYKELEEIRKNIQLLKDYYLSEYIQILMSRMDSIRSWSYNFDKKGYKSNQGMNQMKKEQIKIIQLKIKQRMKILSLLK